MNERAALLPAVNLPDDPKGSIMVRVFDCTEHDVTDVLMGATGSSMVQVPETRVIEGGNLIVI